METPIKIYIAGKFSSRHRLRKYKQVLLDMGYDVLSTWIDREGEDSSLAHTEKESQQEADRDTQEVNEANIFIIDTFDESNTGGREVELGMARASHKYVFIVGPARNVFHTVHTRFESWNDLLYVVEGLGK